MTPTFALFTPATWPSLVARAVRGATQNLVALARAINDRQEVKHLAELDDRALKDIGLVRSDVEGALSEPWFCRPSAALLRTTERGSLAHTGSKATSRSLRPLVPLVGTRR